GWASDDGDGRSPRPRPSLGPALITPGQPSTDQAPRRARVTLVYLDSSALVKLVVREPESAALSDFLREHGERASSTLALTEVPRALRRAGFGRAEHRRAQAVLRGVALVAADRPLLSAAAERQPPALWTLDAIHLATALTFGDELAALVTYDRRLTEAAGRARVRALAPA